MNSKSDSRIRRAAKTRIRISQQDKPRLSVFKSSQNLYAQIFDSSGSTVLASASTNENANKMSLKNMSSAKAIGQKIAERDKKVEEVYATILNEIGRFQSLYILEVRVVRMGCVRRPVRRHTGLQ